MTSKAIGPTIPLPFIRDYKIGRGGPRRNFWTIKPTGDEIKDRRTGREAALTYMAWEAERFASDPEHESIINLIVQDITASGDRSAVVAGFFSTLAGCSIACWRPEEVERFRRHYQQDRQGVRRTACRAHSSLSAYYVTETSGVKARSATPTIHWSPTCRRGIQWPKS